MSASGYIVEVVEAITQRVESIKFFELSEKDECAAWLFEKLEEFKDSEIYVTRLRHD